VRSASFDRLPARVLALFLCFSLFINGCAFQPPPVTAQTAEPLSTNARIIADEQPIDVSGFEITEEERARLEQQRSANLHSHTTNPIAEKPGEFVGRCLIQGMIVFCPILAAMYGIGLLAYNAGALAVGAAKDGTYIPAKGDGVRLAALFGAHARSATLRNGVAKRIPAERADALPPLVVRIESASLVPVLGGVVFHVTARVSDDKGQATTHQAASPRRTMEEWLGSGGSVFREDIDTAIEALSLKVAYGYTRGERVDGMPPVMPREGDNFTYQLVRGHAPGGERVIYSFRVKLVTTDVIVEEFATADMEPSDWAHTDGGYLLTQGVRVFSPYLGVLSILEPGNTLTAVQHPASSMCQESGWTCSSLAQVIGPERVEVPAGVFDAIKVEVDESWASEDAKVVGGRTLTIWYVQELKRAVKFSNREHTRRDRNTRNFSLEMLTYDLR
jgi:hypothetical protein